MAREAERKVVQLIRENLTKELEELYTRNFDNLITLNLSDSYLAKITQLLLTSREAAIKPLKEVIESPLITKAPEHSD